jgi:hypothetical protein
MNRSQPQQHHRYRKTKKLLGHGQQSRNQTKRHPQKTCQKLLKMLLRTEEVAARSSRGKTEERKQGQQHEN